MVDWLGCKVHTASLRQCPAVAVSQLGNHASQLCYTVATVGEQQSYKGGLGRCSCTIASGSWGGIVRHCSELCVHNVGKASHRLCRVHTHTPSQQRQYPGHGTRQSRLPTTAKLHTVADDQDVWLAAAAAIAGVVVIGGCHSESMVVAKTAAAGREAGSLVAPACNQRARVSLYMREIGVHVASTASCTVPCLKTAEAARATRAVNMIVGDGT